MGDGMHAATTELSHNVQLPIVVPDVNIYNLFIFQQNRFMLNLCIAGWKENCHHAVIDFQGYFLNICRQHYNQEAFSYDNFRDSYCCKNILYPVTNLALNLTQSGQQ